MITVTYDENVWRMYCIFLMILVAVTAVVVTIAVFVAKRKAKAQKQWIEEFYKPRQDTLTKIMRKKYADREDKDNIYGVGITDTEFRRFAIDYLLGPNWYVADSIGKDQINEIALYEILEKFSSRYRKEKKEEGGLR